MYHGRIALPPARSSGLHLAVMPELRWGWGYALFWVICVVTVAWLIRFFRRKRWIGDGDLTE